MVEGVESLLELAQDVLLTLSEEELQKQMPGMALNEVFV